MKRSRLIQLALFFGILLIGLFSMNALIGSKKMPPKEENKEIVKYLKVKKAANTDIEYQFTYTGRVLSSEIVTVSSEVNGLIKRGNVTFKMGENFRKGDVLLRIEDTKSLASLKSAKSGLLTNMSRILPDIEIDFPDQFPKWQKFFSAIDLNKKLPEFPEFDTDKEKVFMASRNILTDYFNIVQQEITYSKHTIRAPFNGSIVECTAEVGAVANPGAMLGKIIRTDMLEIDVPVNVQDRKLVKVGDKCRIINNNGVNTIGKISRIAGFVNTQTQMVSVFVKVDNPDLMKGEYIKANFSVQSNDKGVVLPREAVDKNGMLYTIKDGILNQIVPDIMRIGDDEVIVRGIADGTMIVSESFININAGDKVSPIEANN